MTVEPLVRAERLTTRYKKTIALDAVDLCVPPGRIVGLIGPNGAGKTTLLNRLLGLAGGAGTLSVAGHDPLRSRDAMMREVCFIADVATLPRWLRVREVIDVVAGLHPRFSRSRCQHFLERSSIEPGKRIGQLSKGMTVQLHLALIMAIDARLLILDEPTLGLDLLFRRSFYENLLGEYFDDSRSIIITTHQVEEIEHVLTDVIFLVRGRKILDAALDDLAERFIEVRVPAAALEQARQLGPIGERRLLGAHALIYDLHAGPDRHAITALAGEPQTPSLADLFTACVGEARP